MNDDMSIFAYHLMMIVYVVRYHTQNNMYDMRKLFEIWNNI